MSYLHLQRGLYDWSGRISCSLLRLHQTSAYIFRLLTRAYQLFGHMCLSQCPSMVMVVMCAGAAEGRQHTATAEVYLSEFCDAKLPKHGVTAVTTMSRHESNMNRATVMLR